MPFAHETVISLTIPSRACGWLPLGGSGKKQIITYLPGVNAMVWYMVWFGPRPTTPPADANGGGPAGGGVPGGVRKKPFTLSSVAPAASLTMTASCTCVPTFLIATAPVPVNDA